MSDGPSGGVQKPELHSLSRAHAAPLDAPLRTTKRPMLGTPSTTTLRKPGPVSTVRGTVHVSEVSPQLVTAPKIGPPPDVGMNSARGAVPVEGCALPLPAAESRVKRWP